MIPLQGDARTRRFPLVTLVIIVLNVAVFIFALTLPRYGMTLGGFYAKAGATPYELAHGLDVPPGDLVPWWATLFTSMFIHGGWLYLIFNMLYLWIFGSTVEKALGRVRFLGLYVTCGLVATATQVLTDPGSTAPLIGAGGAVAGVLGAYLVLPPRAGVRRVFTRGVIFPVAPLPTWILLGIWFAWQAVEGVLSFRRPDVGVAFLAQVGGFLAGVGLGFALARRGRKALRRA